MDRKQLIIICCLITQLGLLSTACKDIKTQDKELTKEIIGTWQRSFDVDGDCYGKESLVLRQQGDNKLFKEVCTFYDWNDDIYAKAEISGTWEISSGSLCMTYTMSSLEIKATERRVREAIREGYDGDYNCWGDMNVTPNKMQLEGLDGWAEYKRIK